MGNAEKEIETIRRDWDDYCDRIWRRVEAERSRNPVEVERRLARLGARGSRHGPLLIFVLFVFVLIVFALYVALSWKPPPGDPLLNFPALLSMCVSGGVTVYLLSDGRWRWCVSRLYLLLWWGIPLFLLALSPQVPSAVVAVGGLVYVELLLVLSIPLYREISANQKEAGLEAIFWAFQVASIGGEFGGDGGDDADIGF